MLCFKLGTRRGQDKIKQISESVIDTRAKSIKNKMSDQ